MGIPQNAQEATEMYGGRSNMSTGNDACKGNKEDCLQKALNSYSLEKSVNSMVGFGAGTAAFGATAQILNKSAKKPRVGISGGGKSGNYTSYSRRYFGDGKGKALGRMSIGSVAKRFGILGAGFSAWSLHFSALNIYLECVSKQ